MYSSRISNCSRKLAICVLAVTVKFSLCTALLVKYLLCITCGLSEGWVLHDSFGTGTVEDLRCKWLLLYSAQLRNWSSICSLRDQIPSDMQSSLPQRNKFHLQTRENFIKTPEKDTITTHKSCILKLGASELCKTQTVHI